MYTPPKLFWHPVSGLHADGVPQSHHLAQLCWARLRPNPLTMNLSAQSPSEDICCVLRWMQRFHWMPRIGLDIFAWPYWWKSWPTVQVQGTGQNVGMGQNAVPLRYVHVCTGCSKQHWTTTNLALSKTNKREEYPQHGVVQDWAQATAVELRLEILAPPHWQPIAESKDPNGDSVKVVKVTRTMICTWALLTCGFSQTFSLCRWALKLGIKIQLGKASAGARKRRIGYLHQRFDVALCLWMLIIVHPPIKNRLSAVTGGQNKSAKDRYISKLPRMKAQNGPRSAADYLAKKGPAARQDSIGPGSPGSGALSLEI